MSKVILFICAILASTATLTFAACTVKGSELTYDLSKIPASSFDIKSEEKFDYKFNFCDNVSETRCKSANGLLCSYEKDGNFKAALAIRGDGYAVTEDPGSVTIRYSNGKDDAGRTVSVTFYIFCSKEDNASGHYNDLGGIHEINIESPAGCPFTGGGDGLSGGWVFIIILLVALFLWLVVATLVNIFVFKANKDTSAIIGLGLVRSFFTNALDGTKFVFAKIFKSSAAKANNDNGYATFE